MVTAPRVPDAAQRATLLRRAGTHGGHKYGPRLSSAPLRAAQRPGNETHSAVIPAKAGNQYAGASTLSLASLEYLYGEDQE
jgi:hypothetical protein